MTSIAAGALTTSHSIVLAGNTFQVTRVEIDDHHSNTEIQADISFQPSHGSWEGFLSLPASLPIDLAD